MDRLPSENHNPGRAHDGRYLPRLRQAHEHRPRRRRGIQNHKDDQDRRPEADQAHARTRHHPRREHHLPHCRGAALPDLQEDRERSQQDGQSDLHQSPRKHPHAARSRPSLRSHPPDEGPQHRHQPPQTPRSTPIMIHIHHTTQR